MAIALRLGGLGLIFAFFCSCSKPTDRTDPIFAGAPASASEIPFAEYVPGQYLSLDNYGKLGHLFAVGWRHATGADLAQNNLNAAIEPEATLAMLRLLHDPNTNIFYGGYTRVEGEIDDNDFSFGLSKDGLLGLRVAFQLEVASTRGPLLLSSFVTYDYDFNLHKLIAREGADTMRIRIEVMPFRAHFGYGNGMTGFAGFSWMTKLGQGRELASAKGQSYVNERGKFVYKNVTPCGFADHCTLCHHAQKRNLFSEAERQQPPENSAGFEDLVNFVAEHQEVTDTEVAALESALKTPKTTFRSKALIQALRKRWNEIK